MFGGRLTEQPSGLSSGERSARNPVRPDAVEPYVRGAAWPPVGGVAYPRGDLTDTRLPLDTRSSGTLPVGVRLEITGDATEVEIRYETATDELGHRGAAAGVTFSVWRGNQQVDEQPARLGVGVVRVQLGSGGDRAIVYLPEGMKPVVTAVTAVGGSIAPAPRQPSWVAYGDSIAEGWIASGPAHAWPAIAARQHGLDVTNMGYAGSARGEIVSADHIAGLPADVISVSHGTNCWMRVPHSVDMMRSTTEAFLRLVRAGHPGVPIVVGSPVVRPDAEETPNALGATLGDLRRAMEEAVSAVGGDRLVLVPGRDVLAPALLADGVHPGDEGHRLLAEVLGGAVREAYDRAG